jgi:YNFM family putative membrane transporter
MATPRNRAFALQALVFLQVCAAFTTIYITQPVLPVLREEFGVDATTASYTIAAVVLGIALATLPFGALADRQPVRPIILAGGIVVAGCGLVCAITPNLNILIAARFVQGLFIPALTSCLVAYLARSLPAESLNVVMGSYVSATVTGGLGGRLLGGFIHPPLNWRYAFVTASLLVLAAALTAVKWLPRSDSAKAAPIDAPGIWQLLMRKELLRIYIVAFGAFFVFSSVFNYLPFYLSGPPFHAPTEVITFMYLAYVIGIIVGPLAGKLSNRIGNGTAMVLGTLVLTVFIGVTLITSFVSVVISLMGICAGFFTLHAAAAGALNRKLTGSQGRANSLYVLFYYTGGAVGIAVAGYAYGYFDWRGVAGLTAAMLLVPLATGLVERADEKKGKENNP